VTIDNYSIEIENLPIKIKVGNREVKAYLSKKEGAVTDVILGLHGGSTSKKLSEAAAKNYNQKSDGGRPFIQAGFALLSLEYTEFEDNGDKATRGIKEMEEVLAAVDFMLNDGLTENNVTFDRVFVLGHSRGGANALLAGIERAVDGVISTAGPLDWIATYDSIQSGYLQASEEELAFFNESTAAWGDPHEDPTLWTKYSPGLRTTQFQSPFLVVSGINDAVVMIWESYGFCYRVTGHEVSQRFDDLSLCETSCINYLRSNSFIKSKALSNC